MTRLAGIAELSEGADKATGGRGKLTTCDYVLMGFDGHSFWGCSLSGGVNVNVSFWHHLELIWDTKPE
jgi:hypothetical protein